MNNFYKKKRNKVGIAGMLILASMQITAQDKPCNKIVPGTGKTYYQIVDEKNKQFAGNNLRKINDRKAWKHFQRWAYYWKDRVNSDGTFPSEIQGYVNAGILNSDGSINTNFNKRSAGTITTSAWTNVGPQSIPETNGYSNYPQLGRLNCFLRLKHPTNQSLDVLFVGAPNGGIWKSTNGGTTWSPKLDFIASLGINDIKMASDASISNYTTKPMYVVTGDYDGSHSKSIGVLKSTNGGETFISTKLNFLIQDEETTADLLVLDDKTVIVGTNKSIQKTTDGGTTWVEKFNDQTINNYKFARFAKSGDMILVFDIFGGCLRSDDDGETWTRIIDGTEQNKLTSYVKTDGTIYIQDQKGQIKEFDSSNNTFINVGTIPAEYNSQDGYNQTFLFEDNFAANGEFNGSHSVDNGDSWYRSLNGYWNSSTDDGTYIHSDHHRLGFLDKSTNKIWSVNDGGLSYIDYGTGSVSATKKPIITYKSEKVIVTQSYSCAINPTDNGESFLMANQDNDAFSKVGTKWYAVAAGDGIQSAINYNNPDIRYVGDQNGSITRSKTGYINELQGSGSVEVPGASFYFPLEMNKIDPTILYAGGTDVYKIVDDENGYVINPLNAGFTSEILYSISTHGNSILASNKKQIRMSTDDGVNWENINLPDGVEITSVDFNGTNSSILYCTASGYNDGNKVFKSIDGGLNWENISAGLPNIITKEVLLKQNQNSEILFLATELGVYKYMDKSWNKLDNALPNVDVKDIEFHYTADKIVAATFGRGLWEKSDEKITNLNSSAYPNETELQISPNPVENGKLHFKTSLKSQLNYQIYNAMGGIVLSGKLENNTIDISTLSTNSYIVRLIDGSNSITRKFSVK